MNNIMQIQSTLTKQAKKGYERNAFGARHANAWQTSPIAKIINGLAAYADDYNRRYPESQLADDYVLGKDWERALRAVRGLLNGELGGLDGGFTDSIILDLATKNGFETNNW